MNPEYIVDNRIAHKGNFIMDRSPLRRSLGYVMHIDEDTGMMQVNFPKTGKLSWVIWDNHGQYVVV